MRETRDIVPLAAKAPDMRGRPAQSIGFVALLAFLTIGGWSLLFRSTYGYTFYWDDFHFIRCYSWPEIQSVFHGPNDPDGIETPALRPVATLLFHAQGCLFGEKVRLQRTFMAALMGILLWTIGLLLREVGLSALHTAIVFLLFASSRVFASLVLWMTLGSAILAYLFMVLTAYFFVRWAKRGNKADLALVALSAAFATCTREEAYTLPLALPVLWLIARYPRAISCRRVLSGAAGVLAIVAVHFTLRGLLIPRPPGPRLSLDRVEGVVTSMASAWFPGGLEVWGDADWLLSLLWKAFLGALVLALLRKNSYGVVLRSCAACALGGLLCAPALGVARSFGVALPAVAFFTATSMAAVEVLRRASLERLPGRALYALVLGGLAVGVIAGIRRSQDVADSMHPNCAAKVLRDGRFLFDRRAATIPPERRQAGLDRLAAIGIRSSRDLQELERDMHHPRRYFQNRETRAALFLTRCDYLSF